MTVFTDELINQARSELAGMSTYAGLPQSRDAVTDALARSAWSGIGEPGDRVMGWLCEVLGPVLALDALHSAANPGEFSAGVMAASLELGLYSDDTEGLAVELREAYDRWSPRISAPEALAHIQRAQRLGARLVTPSHPAWPDSLARLGHHAPVALWLRGDVRHLESLNRSIAIVGARASTGYGEHVTMELTSGLVSSGFAIVSGGAYGIDGMAHRATLASSGTTVAVLAGGIDRLYPSGHDALLNRVIEQGLVLTELPCGFAPTKWRFLQRNRLIAALSNATVVVEAGWRSGSLNTAHHALDMDIPVGAVPGPVTSASSNGCHRLLRETPAVCVTTASEIVQLATGTGSQEEFEGEDSPNFIRVSDALSRRTGRSVSQVATITGLGLSDVTSVLGILSLRGTVRENDAGWVRV